MSDTEAQNEGVGGKGKSKGERKITRKRSPLAATIEEFSPTWFAICMNSGILSILMHQLPYQFHGLPVLATIAYVVDLVLFIIFSVLMILRLIFYPSSAIHKIGSNANELAFLACWPIAWLTLCAGTALVVSQSYWGGHAFTLAAYCMWWFGAVWTFVTSLIVYMTLFRKKLLTFETVIPAILVPAVGVATVASTGGLIAGYAHDISPGLQIPIIIVAYVLLGQGVFLALMIYAGIISKLISSGFPPPAQLPSLILFMGPTGQCATALQLLGSTANTNSFAAYNRGTFITGNAAMGLDAASMMLSLLIFGFGVFLLCISLMAILEAAWKKELVWSFAWWSTIFPMGTMNTAMLVYSTAMDSPAWRVLTAGLLIILVIDYFVCAGFTVYYVVWGNLLVPADAGKEGGKEV